MKNYKEITINTYNTLVQQQAKKFKDLSDFEKRLDFKTFLKMFKGKTLLDLGSGSGEHAAYFESKGIKVTCVDLSKEMIKICKDKGLSAILMDIEKLDFPENSFDGVWGATSLLHIPKKNVPKVLNKLQQIVKPKGSVYISLKEGTGELFVPEKDDKSQERFFSLWTLDEFSQVAKKYFEIEIARVETSIDGKRKILAYYLQNNK